MENNGNGAPNKRLYVATIVVLLLINFGTLYILSSTKQAKAEVTIQEAALERDFKNLTDTLDVKKTQLQQYIGKNAELDQTIAANQIVMEKQKTEIAGLLHKTKLTDAELAKAKGMIAQYQASIAGMTKQIADLNTKNEQLADKNAELSHSLDAERVTTAQLNDQNKGLTKKVEVGSLLQLAKVDVEAIKKRHNGKDKHVRRAKSAQELKISFETGNNKILDPGTVSLYLRIINPKGETIAIADQGSGSIAIADSPNPVLYTKKADIDWDRNSKKVTVYWGQNIKDPGVYKVEVYQKGYVVGEGAVKLI